MKGSFKKTIILAKEGLVSKSKLSGKIEQFVERHCVITTDTDSNDFHPGDGDIFELLARWRLVYASLAKKLIEEAIRYRASEADLQTLISALRTSVPGSLPESIIAEKLTSLLKMRYFEKQGVTKDDLALLRPILLSNARASMVLEQLARQLFGEWSEGRARNSAIDRHLVDVRRGKSRKSRAFALFGWLISYPADIEDDYSFPVRKYLAELIGNERTRPRFGEMFKMWQLSGRYPDLEMPLILAMIEDISAIPSHLPKETPRWFVNLLARAEEFPHELRSAIADKAENIKMYLDFEAGTLQPIEKDDGTKVLESSDLPAKVRLEMRADAVFSPNPKPAGAKERLPGIWVYFGRELLASVKDFFANVGEPKPAGQTSQA